MKLKRIVFLDRDGVVNRNPVRYDYVKKTSEFRFLPGARRAIRMLTKAGYGVVIISNQGGVAKGLFSKQDLKAIDKKMLEGVRKSGGRIKGIYYCIHNPEANCECRKPRTGLLKKAIGKTRIDLKGSFFIGDTERDAIAGENFGLQTVTVLCGYNGRKDIKPWKIQPDFIAKDLLSAARNFILTE
jgi:histidinol-phosphate phosphatase family protein